MLDVRDTQFFLQFFPATTFARNSVPSVITSAFLDGEALYVGYTNGLVTVFRSDDFNLDFRIQPKKHRELLESFKHFTREHSGFDSSKVQEIKNAFETVYPRKILRKIPYGAKKYCFIGFFDLPGTRSDFEFYRKHVHTKPSVLKGKGYVAPVPPETIIKDRPTALRGPQSSPVIETDFSRPELSEMDESEIRELGNIVLYQYEMACEAFNQDVYRMTPGCRAWAEKSLDDTLLWLKSLHQRLEEKPVVIEVADEPEPVQAAQPTIDGLLRVIKANASEQVVRLAREKLKELGYVENKKGSEEP